MKAAFFGIAMAAAFAPLASAAEKAAPAAFDGIIAKHARVNGVPETLVRRIIVRESKYNPKARNGGHYGMMQIKPGTAKSMGFQGEANDLLDADVNLTYGVRYLAGAYKVAGGDQDRAVRLYASGYYYDAKRRGMLADVGLGRDGKFRPGAIAPATGSFQLAAADAPTAAKAPAPLPPVRDAQVATTTGAPKPTFFMLGRTPAKPAEPATTLVAATSPAVPLPPVRDAASAAKTGATASATVQTNVVAASAVPLPPVRPGAPAAPLMAAAQPAAQKRVIAPTAQPVLASAGPALPTRPKAPTVEASADRVVPLPPARMGFDPDVTGSIGR